MWPLAAWLAVALGVALRFAQYARNRSLWLDEAMLALNVVARPDLGLAARLDYAQSAAPLFLLAERAAVAAFGVHELALRFTPFVSSLLLLPAVWALARRLLPRGPAAFAVVTTALSPLLLRYATELKPYACDALVATALAAVTLRVLAAPEVRSRWVAVQAVGVVAVWVSIPSAFVLAGAGMSLFVARLQGRAGVTWARLAATAAVWGAAAAGVWGFALRRSAGDAFLRGYFEPAFLAPDAPNLVSRVAEAALVLLQAFWHGGLLAPDAPLLRQLVIAGTAALIAVGMVTLGRRVGPAVPTLLAAPVAAAAVASAVRAYPFAPRTLVFAVPLLAVLAAAGVGAIARASRVGRVGVVVLATLALVSAAVYDVAEVRQPTSAQDEARDVVRGILQREGRRDPVYVSPYALPQWVFYSTRWDAPDRDRLEKYRWAGRSPDGPALQARETRGRLVREGEADGLEYRRRERLELIGLFDGQVVPVAPTHAAPRGRWGQEPDSGWADLEAGRLRSAAAPCVWVLGPALDRDGDLARAIAARGGRLEMGPGRPGVNRARACFGPVVTGPSPWRSARPTARVGRGHP